MNKLLLILKGAAMGIAEVIPGVSGGTIAFISGIYERLLAAIRNIDLQFLRLAFSGKFARAWKYVDGAFIIFLLMGMVCGIVIGVFGVSWLMEQYAEVLYAFFFGLILASAWYIGRQVAAWSMAEGGVLVVGAGVAFVITQVSPAEGQATILYLILSGFLAVSALMLPGISGSFILLLLGMYPVVIGAVKATLSGGAFSELWILVCFGTGMLGGLIVFSRVLTWMFRRYHQLTLALLTGFMLGSLMKIWPWRNPVTWIDAEGIIRNVGSPGAHDRILSEQVVFPAHYHGEAFAGLAILAMVLGVVVILIASGMEKRLQAERRS